MDFAGYRRFDHNALCVLFFQLGRPCFQIGLADSRKVTGRFNQAQLHGRIGAQQTVHTFDISLFGFQVYQGPVIQDADRVFFPANDAFVLIGLQFQNVACIQVRQRIFGIGRHVKPWFGFQGNQIFGKKGTYTQPVCPGHVLNINAAVRISLQQIPGQGHPQRFVLGADVFGTAIGDQIMSVNVALLHFTRCYRSIIDALPGIQPYIFPYRRNLAHVHGREAGLVITAARNKDTAVGGRHVQPACRIHAKGTQVADDKLVNDAVGLNLQYGIISIIALHYLLFNDPAVRQRFFPCRKYENIAFGIFQGHVGCIRIGQLLQVGDGRLAAAANFTGPDLRGLLRIHTNAPGHQRHIPALYVGLLELGLGTHAAFLVHNGVTDGVKKLLFRPGIFRMLIPLHHRVIGCVVPQISSRAVVRLAVGHREHISQQPLALVVDEMGELVKNGALIIVLVLYVSLVCGIRQQILLYRIIGRSVFFGEHRPIRIVPVLKSGIFLVDLPYIRVGLLLGVFHQLLIGSVILQIFPGGNITGAVCPGKLLQDGVVCHKLVKLIRNGIHIRFPAAFRQGLVRLILRQVLRYAGIGFRRTRLGELLAQRTFPGAVLKFLILCLYPGLIISRVLLQAPDIRTLVVFCAGNKAGINPVTDQIVLVHVVAVARLGQRVNETSVQRFQAYVAFFGNNGTHAHIAVLFRQINMLLRFCIHAGGIFTGTIGFRDGIDNNGLFRHKPCNTSVLVQHFLKGTDASLHAGQTDLAAFHRYGIRRLGDIPLRFQGYIPRFSVRILAFAGQSGKHHIAGQCLTFRRTAHDLYVNVAGMGRKRT